MGIDIWSKKDLSGNAMDKTLRTVEIERVRDRVDVQNGDATAVKCLRTVVSMFFSFNLCIHNIPSRAGRDQACREIVRVLKPGGKAVISDFIHTGDYMKAFKSAGAEATRGGMELLFTFPPLRIVEVRKVATNKSTVCRLHRGVSLNTTPQEQAVSPTFSRGPKQRLPALSLTSEPTGKAPSDFPEKL